VPLPSDLPSEVVHAIEMRAQYGLRADLAWVLEVAADPRATHAFGFPMLPEEEQFLWDRHAGLDRYVGLIQRYAAGLPDEFGGLYIDQALGRVMTLWTGDTEGHLAALLDLAGADAPIAARAVRWSERSLRTLQDQVVATVGIEPQMLRVTSDGTAWS
jgi:hypothetical protein